MHAGPAAAPLATMERYAAAWARGDPEAAFAEYADDVVMRIPGRSAAAGEHRGKEAVIARVRELLARTSAVDVEVVDRLVGGERVALLLRERVRSGDADVEIRRVNVYRVRDDRIVEVEIFEADQYAVDALFAADRGG